ncbi:MAG: molybdopterin converting factor subunit 1 [Acidobacteria bacterium]|nr:molybdopterin converting factor subunit 1 [Acidobacteriota bacterium]MCI0567506.1 molybdopterin converting factor subunit 1 [Acidobacteriota bacterium]
MGRDVVRVRVLLFARLRELVGSDAMEFDLMEGATLGELWERLREGFPSVRAFVHPPLMAVNQEYASPDRALTGGDEVAFFPPVSGG